MMTLQHLNRDAMCKQHFDIIGLSDDADFFFTPHVRRLIRESHVFTGGKRHHELVRPLLPPGAQWIDITVPLDEVFARYRGLPHIVVFASGDPLFYGFAVTIRHRLPNATLKVYPYFNSLQLLAHNLLLPYADLCVVSLTGRPWDALDAALLRGEKMIGLLTDGNHTPGTIAQRMLAYGYANYEMHVGIKLGNAREQRCLHLTLDEAAKLEAERPNCAILTRTAPRHIPFGVPDEDFALLNGRKNMITKMPIRLNVIHSLDLSCKRTFWDVGFCTGSIAIEAKRHYPDLQVVAFEKRPEGESLLHENCRRMGTPGIVGVIGDILYTDLEAYPRPDAVFIGGHGGQLAEIIHRIEPLLMPRGCIVMNTVVETSKTTFEAVCEAKGMRLTDPLYLQVDAHNPIYLLKAIKEENNELCIQHTQNDRSPL